MASVAQQLNKTDPVISNLHSNFEYQINRMKDSATIVEGIHADLNNNYRGDSATVFRNKVEEWLGLWSHISRDVTEIDDRLTSASSVIDGATEDARAKAASWALSDQVLSSLT